MRQTDGYTVADYLIQHAGRERSHARVPRAARAGTRTRAGKILAPLGVQRWSGAPCAATAAWNRRRGRPRYSRSTVPRSPSPPSGSPGSSAG
jgi:hypothetical protein